MGKQQFDEYNPETLPGVSFFDDATKRKMRYIYPSVKHWCAGWILVQNANGGWMTMRRATDEDVASISGAIVRKHHADR